jgi:dTMP kinase
MFITFEGIDHCGKSTQIRRVADWLDADRIGYLLVREPGGTIISELIRGLLLDARLQEMCAKTELLLFSAARAQLVREKILPALDAGVVVIADRFYDSSTAYQGYGRGIDIDGIAHLNRFATDQLAPDITFLLDITVEESLARRSQSGVVADRMEKADVAFHERVRQGYLRLAESQAHQFVVLQGTLSVDALFEQIQTIIQERLATAAKEK